MLLGYSEWYKKYLFYAMLKKEFNFENDFNELFNSKLSVTFLKDSFKIGDDCKKCDYFTLCRGGGCKRNRQNADYCKAYKDFFASSYNMILQMSR